MNIIDVNARTEEKFFAILQGCWNQNEGFWDRDKALRILGNEDLIGELFSWVLASDLRGWHSIAARELRKSIAHHESPPDFWLEELWRYASSSVTSDPDEMQHLFGLMHMARSDSVRGWFAEPLISLCERRIEAYVWLGFEGLESDPPIRKVTALLRAITSAEARAFRQTVDDREQAELRERERVRTRSARSLLTPVRELLWIS